MPAAEVVGKWKSQSDFQGGLGRRLFHNLILPPGPTQEAYASLAGFQVITHGRIGVITEASPIIYDNEMRALLTRESPELASHTKYFGPDLRSIPEPPDK